MVVADMDQYHKALEKALLAFHTTKMADINKTVKVGVGLLKRATYAVALSAFSPTCCRHISIYAFACLPLPAHI